MFTVQCTMQYTVQIQITASMQKLFIYHDMRNPIIYYYYNIQTNRRFERKTWYNIMINV